MRWLIIIASLCFAVRGEAQSPALRKDVLDRLAKSEHRLNFAVTSARINTDINLDRAYRDLDTLLAREYGDMFWMYGMAGLYHSSKELLDDATKARFREAWKHRTPYRGDTENHFLMYYSSLLLMSEVWPGLPGSEWFTGRSSKEIHAESREYLLHWMQRAARYGLNEWDSPRYQYYFLTPLLLLANHAKDTTVRKTSSMLVEVMLAELALKYVNGNYVGAHSRTFEAAAQNARIGETLAYAEFFFRDSVIALQPDLAFAALSDWSCPAIISELAGPRSKGVVLREAKQGRPALRYTQTDTLVPKVTYIAPRYSLGSIQDGLVQPIQQQTWKLVFHDIPGVNTITGLHPYISERELATFFPEEPSFQAERIESTKVGYSSENKWVGGSPYQRIRQEQRIIFLAYDIPASDRTQHADFFVPAAIEWKTKPEKDSTLKPHKWYAITGGGVECQLYFTTTMLVSREANGVRLRSRAAKFRAIVRVVEDEPLDSRLNHHRTLARELMDDRKWQRAERAADNSARKYLYSTVQMNSKRGSGVITINGQGVKRVIDFNLLDVR